MKTKTVNGRTEVTLPRGLKQLSVALEFSI